MPASNADIGMTIAHLLGIQPAATGKLSGRVLQESFREGGQERGCLHADPEVAARCERARDHPEDPAVGSNVYFDVAGFSGRTVGLED